MACAVALHVVDEALTGFLPFYNAFVLSLREFSPWVPLPIFSFPVWFTGLAAGIVALFALTPFAFTRKPWLRPVAYFLAVLMTANGMGHLAASVYLGAPAPGVFSSPVLLIASFALFITTLRASRSMRR